MPLSKQRPEEQMARAEEESQEGIFELLAPRAGAARGSGELVLGVLAGLEDAGEPLVDFPGSPVGGPLRARSTVALAADQLGRQVALLFERGDPLAPVVIGVIHQTRPAPDVVVDNERLVLEAQRDIEIRCGESSITLTRDGKVRIRGTDVLTRSSGSNRIKGGSVRIN